MGFKKKSKVSAEFNMSSLTDIIFLLLIFFMLTSSMVIPNALNLELPGKNKRPSTPSKVKPVMVTIDSKGTFFLNGTRINYSALQKRIRSEKEQKGADASITIKPAKKSPTESVVEVMDLAYKYSVKAVMTDPN